MADPLIELRRASKTFVSPGGTEFRALREVSFTIETGEYVAILGKSGSGKSTLLNLIAGLDRPSSGDVQVAGIKLNGLGENRLARWRGKNVGVVFQFFQLLPTLTIEENVAIAMDFVGEIPSAQRSDRALALLEAVGLTAHAKKLPAALSGGQQQRAAIARALANDPPIILADEPTGNLDSETAAEVAALFQRFAAEGKTLLIVTHDNAMADHAQRVIELQDGAILSDELVRA